MATGIADTATVTGAMATGIADTATVTGAMATVIAGTATVTAMATVDMITVIDMAAIPAATVRFRLATEKSATASVRADTSPRFTFSLINAPQKLRRSHILRILR